MKKVIFYANGSAGNHGCEAITRSLIKILSLPYRPTTLTKNTEEDIKYGLSSIVNLANVSYLRKYDFDFIKSYFKLKIKGETYALDLFPYLKFLKGFKKNSKIDLAISVGGDNYCYGAAEYYGKLDTIFHNQKINTALVGCSIEPDVIYQPNIVDALKKHKAIIARESITFDALKNAGLTNIHLIPDPAFMLNSIEMPLPSEFIEGNTVGINLSPLVEDLSSGGNIVYKNAENLISHILATSEMGVCLIPHVIWNHSNDMKMLLSLYAKFSHTGRVSLIPDSPAEVLKGYISRCRFFLAARTHASIAAYSSGVPTFVLGYSVKSRGIARDIFENETDYVKPTKDFKTNHELIDAFEFLKTHESEISVQQQHYTSEAKRKLKTLPNILGIE